MTVYGNTLPRLETFWLTPRIVAAVEAHGACETTRLVTSAFREPSLVFRHGPYDTLLADGPAGAADALAADPSCSLALIDAAEAAPFLARVGTLSLTPQALAVIEGQNYSNGDEMALTLYRAGPAPTGPGE